MPKWAPSDASGQQWSHTAPLKLDGALTSGECPSGPKQDHLPCPFTHVISTKSFHCTRYGVKLDAVALVQDWVRDVGSQAGLTCSNAQILSGAVGVPESRLEACSALPCMLHYILIFGDLGISRNAIAMRLFCPGMSCQSDNRAIARLAAARSGVCFVSGAGGLLGRHPSTGPQGMEPARPGAGRHLCIEWHACTRRAQSTAIAANLASATAVPCLSQHVTVS